MKTLLTTAPWKLSAMVLASFVCMSALGLLAQAPASDFHAQMPAAAQKSQAAAPHAAPTPEQLAIREAAEKDHQRMMDLLGIKQLRPGASNDPNSPNPANYDESKANVYPTLPNPLVLNDGQPVTSAKIWWKQRRPEIVETFRPRDSRPRSRHLPTVNWKVVSTTQEKIGDVAAVTKKLIGHVDNSAMAGDRG